MAPFIFADAIANDKPIQVFNHGDMSRDFTYIDDIVEGITKITFTKQNIASAEIYNIGNSLPVNLLNFITCLEDAFNKKANKIMSDLQPGDVISTWADVSKLDNLVGYSPKTLIQDGTNKFAKWYKSYFKKK
jgi:UDP-glucuronate 4-epimerase